MTRILIVEDDNDCRQALRSVLEAEGFEIDEAPNGLEALKFLHGLGGGPRPDLIMLDLMMPHFNGWDFLIAKNGDDEVKNVPVIVMTAMTVHEARARVLEGALFIIHKPYNIDRLLHVVEHAVHPRPTVRPPPPPPA